MLIKQPYKFYIKENSVNIGTILLIVIVVNIFAGFLMLSFSSDRGSFLYLLNIATPSLNLINVIILVYAFTTFKSSLSIANQFGITRYSSMISNTLSVVTLIASISLFAAFASITYIESGSEVFNLYNNVVSKSNLFIKEFFWVFSSLFNKFAIGTFIIAVWNRLKPTFRLVLFIGFPVLLFMILKRILLSIRMNTSEFVNNIAGVLNFFGYSNPVNGIFSSNMIINVFQNVIAVTFVITIPLLLLSMLISRKTNL